MTWFEDFDIYRYEIGTIINNNRNIEHVTNDIHIAKNYYEAVMNKYKGKNVIVFLFDYDKNCNVKYYDSIVDGIYT